MKPLLLVFLGGGTGSLLRYLISRALNPEEGIPYGTLLVNIAGCLLIGFFTGLILKQQLISPNTALLLVTGFCGGFTTFSTFSYENYHFMKSGDIVLLATYLAASIILGVVAVFFGVYLSKIF